MIRRRKKIVKSFGATLEDAVGKLLVFAIRKKIFQGVYAIFHPKPSARD